MLKKCISKYKSVIALYISNGVIQVLIAAFTVVYFQRLIDCINLGESLDACLKLLLIYGLFKALNYLLNYADNYPHSTLTNGFYYELKLMAMKKISTIEYLQYKNLGTGQLIQMVENGADAGRKILYDYYLNIFRGLLPNLIIGMVFIGFYDYRVLIAISISYILVFFITKLLLKRLYEVKNITLINEELFTSKIVRAFMEMVVFRINRRYMHEITECRDKSSKIIKSKTKILMIHELFFTSFAIIVAVIEIFAIYFGMKQIFAGTSTIGSLVAIITLIGRVYEPIAIFNVEYIDFKLNSIAFKRFQNLINKPDDPMINKGIRADIHSGDIRFDAVSYQYDKTKILDNLSIHLKSGHSYVLVGMSGAGKTTILNLLTGLLKADEGIILIDGHDLSELNLSSYYENISYISQNPPIFDGSIRENLVFNMDISDDKLWSTLKKVNLYDCIHAMENGLDEQIGERGNKLSGGEKQRLALARVIILQPKIVILDEATSALDNINEAMVMSGLFKALPNSTVIAVTHRVHSTYRFDSVILLDNCNVKAIGTTEELLENDELFKRIYEADKKKAD